MLVSGFTVVRNAQLMGYPITQSIRSILPLVDEFIIGVGQSDDGTKELVQSIDDAKIRTFDTFWDTARTTGGLILSEKTNEMLAHCRGDWCFYLQADEVVHEQDLPVIRASMERYRGDDRVEGLLFRYLHFYGSFGVVATARNWYRNEVRIVKRSAGARSVRDAQGFRVGERKPHVRPSGGTIYHYGWVKQPEAMGRKHKYMIRWWHGNKYEGAFDDFAYKCSYGLKYFDGSHPALMRDLVASQDWEFKLAGGRRDWEMRDYKNLLSDVLERFAGHRFGERKNYILLKSP
jgi:hypothetical protein